MSDKYVFDSLLSEIAADDDTALCHHCGQRMEWVDCMRCRGEGKVEYIFFWPGVGIPCPVCKGSKGRLVCSARCQSAAREKGRK